MHREGSADADPATPAGGVAELVDAHSSESARGDEDIGAEAHGAEFLAAGVGVAAEDCGGAPLGELIEGDRGPWALAIGGFVRGGVEHGGLQCPIFGQRWIVVRMRLCLNWS